MLLAHRRQAGPLICSLSVTFLFVFLPSLSSFDCCHIGALPTLHLLPFPLCPLLYPNSHTHTSHTHTYTAVPYLWGCRAHQVLWLMWPSARFHHNSLQASLLLLVQLLGHCWGPGSLLSLPPWVPAADRGMWVSSTPNFVLPFSFGGSFLSIHPHSTARFPSTWIRRPTHVSMAPEMDVHSLAGRGVVCGKISVSLTRVPTSLM